MLPLAKVREASAAKFAEEDPLFLQVSTTYAKKRIVSLKEQVEISLYIVILGIYTYYYFFYHFIPFCIYKYSMVILVVILYFVNH